MACNCADCKGRNYTQFVGIGMSDKYEEVVMTQEKELSALNKQFGGNHYKSRGIEPIEYILKNDMDYCQGNVVKYVTRFREKAGAEDLKKAVHYIQFILESEYGLKSDFVIAGEDTPE